MKIEIVINTYNYQRRLCWMLSSILQQKGELPELLVSISYTKDNGNPTTESVIELFRKNGMNILDVVLTPAEVSNRSVSRNIRLKETNSDWILFADCDLVYDNDFFAIVKKKLEGDKYKNETKVIGCDRYSLNDQFCIKYFEEDKREYPCIIENVVDIPKTFPVKWKRGGETAAGFFQLANVASVRERKGVYSGRNRDLWRATKSDREFRVRMGGRVSINEATDVEQGIELRQYHLNHDRQGPDLQR